MMSIEGFEARYWSLNELRDICRKLQLILGRQVVGN